MIPLDRTWPLVEAVQLACLLEASAPKLGNVHPGANFSDMHLGHFIASAVAIRPTFEGYARSELTHSELNGNATHDDNAAHDDVADAPRVGDIVLSACQATRQQVGRNTNLGTVLLFAPLAVAFRSGVASGGVTSAQLRSRVSDVLAGLDARDSSAVYTAIRVAKPGGLGKRESQDVADDPPEDLRAAMAQVADVDAVARQYVNQFADIFDRLLPWLNEALEIQSSPPAEPLDAICRLQIRWLAHEPDGLIARKLGSEMASEIMHRAGAVWQQLQGFPGKVSELEAACALDRFLREDGHRRNPGTTADCIAATLLVKLLVDR